MESMLFAVVMTINNWDFKKLGESNFETKVYDIEESFKDIKIVADTTDFRFLPSENGKCKVICDEANGLSAEVEVVGATQYGTKVEITIHEGRNRQVRRMCASAGMSVVRLVRIAEGNLDLGTLAEGKWRYLTAEEVSLLRK